MSIAQTNELDFDAAYRGLTERVSTPAFFDKCASLGLVPRDQAEADAFLRMGDQLLELHRRETTKQADGRGELIRQAAAQLDAYLGVAPASVKQASAPYVDDAASLAYAAAMTRHLDNLA